MQELVATQATRIKPVSLKIKNIYMMQILEN